MLLGEEILRELTPPLTPAKLDRLERLLTERETEIALAGQFLNTAGALAELITLLRQLLPQQQRIEGAGKIVLATLARESQGAGESRATMQGVQRLLNTRSRSRLLDVRR
jgi:hypothetical protein